MSQYRQVHPLNREVDAVVVVPGSKSIANRALICAALANGVSTLINCPEGDDTSAMIENLKLLGATIDVHPEKVMVSSSIDFGRSQSLTLNAKLAGTTSRFLTAVSALVDAPTTVTGDEKLTLRPMGDLHRALQSIGADLQGPTPGHIPVTIQGSLQMRSEVELSATISSQFSSAILLIAPLLSHGLILNLVGDVVSQPYIEMTISVMREFGAQVDVQSPRKIVVHPVRYRGTNFTIEPDASSASYPLAIAAVVGGTVKIEGLGNSSMQGDAQFASLLAQMGCDVTMTATSTIVHRENGISLKGIDVNLKDMSDLVPTVAAVAVFASTPTVIRGVSFIRLKESNRIDDLVHELETVGVTVLATEDGMIIQPSLPRSGNIDTHHDHRLAMAFCVIGLGGTGVSIGDPGVVSKSWPSFWRFVESL